MATPELIEGVKKSLEYGKTTDQMEKEMLSNGWSKEDVRDVFLSLGLPYDHQKPNVIKKIVISLLSIVLVATLYFFFFLKTPAIDQIYIDSEYGFSMMYPNGYKPKDIARNKDAVNKIAESRGWNMLIKAIGFTPSSGAKTNFLVVAYVEKPPATGDSPSLQSAIKKFTSGLPQYQSLELVETKIGNLPALQNFYSYQEDLGEGIMVDFFVKILMVYKDDYLYIFDVSWTTNYRHGEKMADIILNSIRL